MKWSLVIILGALMLSACEEHAVRDTSIEGEVTRRITTPRVLDTLYVGQSFRLVAGVECHNPITGVRVDITDGSQGGPYGDGEIVYQTLLPNPGDPLTVDIDTTLTLAPFSGLNADQQYSFFLVEVYENREYRNGFSPLVILDASE